MACAGDWDVIMAATLPPDSRPGNRVNYLPGMSTITQALQVRFVVEGEFDEAMHAAQIEFVADVKAVVVHGAGAQVQFVGDYLAGLISGDEPEDAQLRGRQVGKSWLRAAQRLRARMAVHQKGRNCRAKVRLP